MYNVIALKRWSLEEESSARAKLPADTRRSNKIKSSKMDARKVS